MMPVPFSSSPCTAPVTNTAGAGDWPRTTRTGTATGAPIDVSLTFSALSRPSPGVIRWPPIVNTPASVMLTRLDGWAFIRPAAPALRWHQALQGNVFSKTQEQVAWQYFAISPRVRDDDAAPGDAEHLHVPIAQPRLPE